MTDGDVQHDVLPPAYSSTLLAWAVTGDPTGERTIENDAGRRP